jgi:hypothetical protein
MVASPRRQVQANHRRETLLSIILPVGGAGLALLTVLAVTLLLLLPTRPQVSVLADWLLMIFMLCPVALCLLPVCIGLMTAVFAMNHLHAKTARMMGRAETLSETLVEKTLDATESISEKSISFNATMAHFDPLWHAFDDKEDKDGKLNP